LKKHPVGTVVNFCTNEARFIKDCLEQASIFSKEVVVPVATHFFDGIPENRALLEQIYAAFPDCLFIEYPFVPEAIPRWAFRAIDPAPFWHCISRIIGTHFLSDQIESIFFLDADEIAEGKEVAKWLDASDYEQHLSLKFVNYWYFREPIYRAEKTEDSIVWAQKKALHADLLLHNDERDAIYQGVPNPKRRMVVGSKGAPLFHHFSWVRTKDEMLKKVKSWSHKHDRAWEELVHKEFEGPFKGTDFVHGYQFHTVKPPFTIPESPGPFAPKGKSRVVRLSKEELLRFVKMKKVPFWRILFDF
jgi:hypothetical protein